MVALSNTATPQNPVQNLTAPGQLTRAKPAMTDCLACRVEVVTEGLRGKTRWWRKTPLEIAHPSRPLLGQDCSLMLFAAGSAAKEQVLQDH